MEEEFFDIDKRHGWNTIYQDIRNKSNGYNYTHKDASKVENKILNRYRDVNPFDHSRVRLQRGERDYINASFVEVPVAKRSYILTQGPLPSTTGHFWLMVWEQKTKAVLMLNRIVEKNTVKCHQYWPSRGSHNGKNDIMLKDVGLLVTFIQEEEKCNYTTRKFLLTDFQSGTSREIVQLHYTTWPDFGVPESPASFLNFLFAVRISGALNENVGPPVVHCSAGIGRSGTFCLVDSCLVLIEQNGSSNSLNICELLLQMRHYRMGLIQTPDQLRFSYMAIMEGRRLLLNDAINFKATFLHDNKRKFCGMCKLIHDGSNENLPELNTCRSECFHSPNYPFKQVQNHESSPVSFSSVGEKEESPFTSKSSFNFVSSFNNEADSNNEYLKNGRKYSGVLNEDKSTEKLRRRKERLEKTAAIVQKIKQKQRASEIWQKRRSLMKRFSFGIVILLGTGMFLYRYYTKS